MKKMYKKFLKSLLIFCTLWFMSSGILTHASENLADVWLGKWTAESRYTETKRVWKWWFEVSKTDKGYQIQTHTEGPDKTEILHISANKLEFLFNDELGTHISLTRDGDKISGTVHQPNNKGLPHGREVGQRYPDSEECTEDKPKGDVSIYYPFLDGEKISKSFKATIKYKGVDPSYNIWVYTRSLKSNKYRLLSSPLHLKGILVVSGFKFDEINSNSKYKLGVLLANSCANDVLKENQNSLTKLPKGTWIMDERDVIRR